MYLASDTDRRRTRSAREQLAQPAGNPLLARISATQSWMSCGDIDGLFSSPSMVPVRFLGGTFVPSVEAVSCRFEGTAQAIQAVHEIAGESFDRILPIIELDAG